MSDEVPTEVEQTNGAVTAPPIFHRALDGLYAWMAENEMPDGMTTIRAVDTQPGEPALCADLSVVIYLEKPEDEEPAPEEAA